MMNNKEIEAIRGRWMAISPLDLRRILPEGESPFGKTEDGLADFRGLDIDQSLHRLTLDALDLSYAKMNKGQFHTKVSRCRFDRCEFEGNVGVDFAECSFRHAKLSRCILRGWFVRCDFSNADLSGVRAVEGRFEDCCFEQANLRKAGFYDCEFTRCRIVEAKFRLGSIGGSAFTDCVVEGIDLSNTVVEAVTGLDADQWIDPEKRWF